MYGANVKQALRKYISAYKTAISAIGCTVTQSMHMLIDHSEQFCDNVGYSSILRRLQSICSLKAFVF